MSVVLFKIANITFNTLHYSQPAYLHSILCSHTPVHSLSSTNTNLLTIPFTHTALGARGFVTSLTIWNSLPPALRSCNCPDTFRWHLKTDYFRQAFTPPSYLTCCTADSAFADIVCIYEFYLLTYLLINDLLRKSLHLRLHPSFCQHQSTAVGQMQMKNLNCLNVNVFIQILLSSDMLFLSLTV